MSAVRVSYIQSDDPNSLRVTFVPIEREPKPWRKEVLAAAREIRSRTDKPLWLCSNGGLDAEIMCRAFYEQQIPFSVLTLEHAGGTNAYAVKRAATWCAERTVPHKIEQIDMAEFLSSGIDAYAREFRALHPLPYLQIRILETVERMGGYAVLGSGDQLYHADTKKETITRNDLFLTFWGGGLIPLEWCERNDAAHEPFFYYSTPELCLSYTRIPIVAFALSHPDPVFRHDSNAYTLKRIAYQSAWPDIEVKYKAEAFEKIRLGFEDARRALRVRFASPARFDLHLDAFERSLIHGS